MTPIILFCIGIALILINYRAIKNEKKNFNKMLNHASDNMDEVDVMIGELRREFSETILELQKEIEALKEERSLKLDKEHLGLQNNYDNNKEDNNSDENNDIINNIDKTLIDFSSKQKSHIDENTNKNKIYKINTKKNRDKSKEDANKQPTQNENGTKIDQVQIMLSQGYSVEEVAEQLNIGKGEVLLVKELYRR